MEDPYWIGIHPIMRQSVTSLRLIWPDERPHFLRRGDDMDIEAVDAPLPPRDATRPGVPVRQMSLQPWTGMPNRRVGHLVVLDGGKNN